MPGRCVCCAAICVTAGPLWGWSPLVAAQDSVLLPVPWPECRVWGLLVSLVTRLCAQHHFSWQRAVGERDPSWCPACLKS